MSHQLAHSLPAWLRWPLPGAQPITCAAVLLVTLPVTAILFSRHALPVALGTLLVAAAFLKFGFHLKSSRLLPVYCVGAGGLAGWVNTPLSCSIMVLGESHSLGEFLMATVLAGLFGFIGAVVGIPYGVAYYLPLRFEQRARNLPSTDASERTLLACGAWALSALLLTASLAKPHPYLSTTTLLERLGGYDPGDWVALSWQLALLVSVSMLIVGAARLLGRHHWVGRVRQNRVPRWHLYPLSQFSEHVVAELPTFSRAWLFKSTPSVLVHESQATGYREPPLQPVCVVS